MHIKDYINPVIKSLSAKQAVYAASMQYITFDYGACVNDPNVPLLIYHLGSGELEFCEDPSGPYDDLPSSGTIKCSETGEMEHPITANSVKSGGTIDCASLSMNNIILDVTFEDESAFPEYCTITNQVMDDDENDVCD